MPVEMSQSLDEEDAVLKDLVSRTLLSNGALGKLQAELRAGVFLALEEEIKDRDVPLCNRQTQELLASPAGSLAASLVHDFLTCLGLDFSLSVYGPESNLEAGLWNLINRQELVQHLNLGQDKEPRLPLLLWQCREQQHLSTRDMDGTSLQKLDTKDYRGRVSTLTHEDKVSPSITNRLNTNKQNNTNSESSISQKRNLTTPNGNDSQSSSSHSINNSNNSRQNSSQSKSGLPEVTTNLPVVSKTVGLGAVGSELNTSVALAKAGEGGRIADTAATSKHSVVGVSKKTESINEEKIVTCKAETNKISSNKISDTNITSTSRSSAGLVTSISKSSDSFSNSKSPLVAKTSITNAKGITSTTTVVSSKLTSHATEQTSASNSMNALPGVEKNRRPFSSHSRQRESAVIHPPENILSAAPPDTRADSADTSSSASEGDLQRLASSVIKGTTAPTGRPRQPLPTGAARTSSRVPKTGLDQADEPDYGEDEDFSTSTTWSIETKSGEDDVPSSSSAADKDSDKVTNKHRNFQEKHTAQNNIKAKQRIKSPEDSDQLDTEEDLSIGDFTTSESVSGREETEDMTAPSSRSAVVDYEETV